MTSTDLKPTFDPNEKPLNVVGDIKSFKPSIDKNKIIKTSDLYSK